MKSSPRPQCDVMGCYLYCIGRTDRLGCLKTAGIAGQGVRVVAFEDLAAVVSDHPVGDVPILRENMIAHQRVMEDAMQRGTILPVRFSTVAEPKNGRPTDERVVDRVLKERGQEMRELLETMRDQVELGLKAVWADMGSIFKEITQEDGEIRQMQARLLTKSQRPNQGARVALGQAVQSALLTKKKAESENIFRPLQGRAEDIRVNKNFGDSMFLNAAFLIKREREAEFDRSVEELSRRGEGRFRLKYVGPVPICNFVEIVVVWD